MSPIKVKEHACKGVKGSNGCFLGTWRFELDVDNTHENIITFIFEQPAKEEQNFPFPIN